MGLKVIGAGVGRTGTYSLKLAVNQLGFGPCHHMEEVLHNMGTQVPLWSAAVDDSPDWSAIYDGYDAAVDWPTACFYRELAEAFPSAKFILTERDPERWADSFGATIQKLIAERDRAPAEMHAWLDMARAVIERTGFSTTANKAALVAAFAAHNAAVRETIPAERLLVFEVRQGWAPLCEFLDVAVPDDEFPRTNHREEFWDRVQGGS